jgi:hypothetical protein
MHRVTVKKKPKAKKDVKKKGKKPHLKATENSHQSVSKTSLCNIIS